MKIIDGGVTAAKGFKAAAAAAEIKYKGRTDMAMVYSEVPCVAVNYSEEEATKILSEEAVTAIADVKMGDATATAWGCDLTYDYIKINADYRS